MKIGVFDSGIGGLSVAKAIKKALPRHEVVFKHDSQNFPYGQRSPQELLQLVIPLFEGLVSEGCDIIVVACNTVSTTLIQELRAKFSVPLIAVEPMVKPAASLTVSKVVAVCATPATLTSNRYRQLKHEYAQGVTVLEPDCGDWAAMIEKNEVDKDKIRQRIEEVLRENADVIVLGCTHYHWIEREVKEIAEGRALVLQPEPAVVAQLRRVLALLA